MQSGPSATAPRLPSIGIAALEHCEHAFKHCHLFAQGCDFSDARFFLLDHHHGNGAQYGAIAPIELERDVVLASPAQGSVLGPKPQLNQLCAVAVFTFVSRSAADRLRQETWGHIDVYRALWRV